MNFQSFYELSLSFHYTRSTKKYLDILDFGWHLSILVVMLYKLGRSKILNGDWVHSECNARCVLFMTDMSLSPVYVSQSLPLCEYLGLFIWTTFTPIYISQFQSTLYINKLKLIFSYSEESINRDLTSRPILWIF